MLEEANDWMTPEARDYFYRWRLSNEQVWRAEGADPEEVREDVLLHLRAKADALGRPLDVQDLENALGEMGIPVGAEKTTPYTPPAPISPPKKRFFLWRWIGMLNNPFFLGWFPLIVVLFEAATGILGGIVFDPISRWPQLVLLLGVSSIGLAGQLPKVRSRLGKILPFLCGLGLASTLYWGLLSGIVIVGAGYLYCAGVIVSFGIGLLLFPFVLICMVIAAAPLLTGFGLWKNSYGTRKSTSWMSGAGLGILLLITVEGPAYLTRYGVVTENPALVRRWGSQEMLYEITCGSSRGWHGSDTSGFLVGIRQWSLFDRGTSNTAESAVARRRFYYRVTGDSPNIPSASSYLSSESRRWNGGFDPNLGGDEVGPIVDDLELSSSRLDGHIDSASGLGYWEWTMEFHNSGLDQKEARLQVLLPPGGVVSRLTLWINGEPEEAAFGAKSQVTAAYKSVVQRRRDPVLVRWVGPDRVLVQCFPVPPEGEMKIRFGVTAPLDQHDRFFLPKITEQNHDFGKSLETAIWVQGDVEMSMEGLEGSSSQGRWRETHGLLSLDTLTETHSFVQCHEHKTVDLVWTEDPFSEEGDHILVRERLPDQQIKSEKVILVVDGSKHFAPWYDSFRRSLEDLKAKGIKTEIIYAAEEGVLEGNVDPNFEGGQDNLPALVRGVELAMKTKADELIWLHGPQPVALENTERLTQLIERSFQSLRISTIDLGGGPNRLLEQLQSSISLSSNGRPTAPDELEETMIRMIHGSRHQYRYRTQPEGSVPEGRKVWDHLARWHVWKEVQQAADAGKVPDDLAQKAATYQLVTPVSGGVVLETQSQYARAGLTQVDESTTPSIPGIPEPSTSLLLILASGFVWRRRREP